MAVAFEVAYVTTTSWPDTSDNVTVKVALPAASVNVTSLIESVGGVSLSTIVKIPVASLMLALLALESVNVAVSFASSSVSARTGTVNV